MRIPLFEASDVRLSEDSALSNAVLSASVLVAAGNRCIYWRNVGKQGSKSLLLMNVFILVMFTKPRLDHNIAR